MACPPNNVHELIVANFILTGSLYGQISPFNNVCKSCTLQQDLGNNLITDLKKIIWLGIEMKVLNKSGLIRCGLINTSLSQSCTSWQRRGEREKFTRVVALLFHLLCLDLITRIFHFFKCFYIYFQSRYFMEVFLRDLRPITSINEKVLKELSLTNICDR